MIPKIIHYCWLSGDDFPPLIQKCIESWKTYLPEYQFMLWDKAMMDSISNPWLEEAFDAKKYAFAADYIRLYALYNYGGIYLDTDVEVLKSFNSLLHLREIICFENTDRDSLEVAAFGAEKHRKWIKCCLDYYENRHFIKKNAQCDRKPLPFIVRDRLNEFHYNIKKVNDITELTDNPDSNTIQVLPFKYFSPKSYITGELEIYKDTFSIHHFAGSWHDNIDVLADEIAKNLNILPKKIRGYVARFFAVSKIKGLKIAIKETFAWIRH